MNRKKALAGGVSVLSAALVAGIVLAPVADATDMKHSGGFSAYAISGTGLLKVDPRPSVTDAQGFSEESLADLKLPQALAELKALNARAGSGQSRASIGDLKIGLGAGKPVLTASAIEARCGHGNHSSTLARAALGDHKLGVGTAPNTKVAVPGLASVTLNKQVTNKDGSVTVTAISIDVDGIQKLDLASCTCNEEASSPTTGTSSSQPTSVVPVVNGKAPAPTPVKAHLDVTG
ncbi:choice-of-anchor P family protein [Amycolatopsis pigmentata]|uniref:Choice-of-anchor P family protein n=1 Tax=Amycolatopsis pigmentata TaxID=450801 RepID=A0ABW5FTS4_9PSEU